MSLFESYDSAVEIVALYTDVRTKSFSKDLGEGITISSQCVELGLDSFTNLYIIDFLNKNVRPKIKAFDKLTSPADFLKDTENSSHKIAISGGFFFLADVFSRRPRELALNLSSSQGQIRSLPVTDREAVIVDNGIISVRLLTALGSLTIGDRKFSWSGSRTDYDTDAKIYGNGNTIIKHVPNNVTGSLRVLEDSSRYTPLAENDQIDIGYIRIDGRTFKPVSSSMNGCLDIFAYDLVARFESSKRPNPNLLLKINTIGGIAVERFFEGSFSAGPMLNIQDFEGNPINKDPSLGDKPPFTDKRMARLALFGTSDGKTKVALFDGRPNSPTFSGVTPKEASEILFSLWTVDWGCFLDPGQTSKICTIKNGNATSYGNRHYLVWPDKSNKYFTWVPDQGRKIANLIAI